MEYILSLGCKSIFLLLLSTGGNVIFRTKSVFISELFSDTNTHTNSYYCVNNLFPIFHMFFPF